MITITGGTFGSGVNLNAGSGTSIVNSTVNQSIPPEFCRNLLDDGKTIVGRSVEEVLKRVQPKRRNVIAFISTDVPGGTGKTSYARKVALALRTQFQRHYIEVEWRGAISTMEDIMLFLNRPFRVGLSIQKQYSAASAELRDSILLLDGLRSAEDAAEVESLLPSATLPCCVLITSRTCPPLSDAPPIEVGIFDEPCSVEMLQRLLTVTRPDIPSSALPRLAVCCGYIPLALDVVAGLCNSQRSRSAESVCDMLDASPADRIHKTKLDKCFQISYQCQSADVQQTWRRVAIWSIPVTEEDFRSVFVECRRGILHELAASALLNDRSGTFHMHDAVREYLDLLISAEERVAACQVIIRRYYWPCFQKLEDMVQAGTFAEATKIYTPRRAGIEMCLRSWLLNPSMELPKDLLLQTALQYAHAWLHYLPADLLESLFQRAVSISNFSMPYRYFYGRALHRCGKDREALPQLIAARNELVASHLSQCTFPIQLFDDSSLHAQLASWSNFGGAAKVLLWFAFVHHRLLAAGRPFLTSSLQ